MPEAVDVAPHHADARIDLLSAVVSRVTEREQPLGVNLAVIEPDVAVGDVDVAILHDEAGGARAPERVPRAQILAAEAAFDAWTPEGPGHHSVELSSPAERDRAGARSKVGENSGKNLIALLPIATRDVKLEP